MTAAVVINGQVLAEQVRFDLKDKVALLDKTPELAVVMVGHNPASEIYVKAKERACAEVGIISSQHHLEEDASEEEVLDLIDSLNHNRDVTGILVQLPLPKHLDEKRVLYAIAPEKDVDGFHPLNTGCMVQKRENAFVPCTPKGIMRIVHYAKEDITGLHAVVVGRSQIVGLPVANLLLQENCTVTIAHSKTKNLPEICREADILVVAIGKPQFITKEYIKPGAIVVDVGINRTDEGLKGDVCFDDAYGLASYLTPVPKGVGPMTIAMLLENTYQAYLKQNRS
jgi:methylenetetrahydrofolate dehydrogenase (NADP+)/methenyltetrahydrofolate cyclohydrolase